MLDIEMPQAARRGLATAPHAARDAAHSRTARRPRSNDELHNPDALRATARTAGGILRAARPRQWSKNVFVFAAIAAAGQLTHPSAVVRVIAAFAVFSLTASGIYLINDVLDAEADRKHPTKRFRPIAARVITPRAALLAAAGALTAGVAGAYLLRPTLCLVIVGYIVLQAAYSLKLKYVPIVDLLCVSAGFVLRAIAGGVAVPVHLSAWFLVVATFASLLMITGKRLAEHKELGERRSAHRKTLAFYNQAGLRALIVAAAGGAIAGYCLWAFDLETAALHHASPIWFQLSILPVLAALLRFLRLVNAGKGGAPERLVFGDRQLLTAGAAWLVLFSVAVYV